MRITTEKVVLGNGEKAREIVSIEKVLELSELPQLYKEGRHCYYDAEYAEYKEICFAEGYRKYYIGGTNSLRIGDQVNEERFQEILTFLATCKMALHSINEKIKRIAKEWNGTETFVI